MEMCSLLWIQSAYGYLEARWIQCCNVEAVVVDSILI